MTGDGTWGLSRRRLLGAAGTVGTAGALGGAGTLAFFSDRESFANGRLTAGELDVRAGWVEHYSDWSGDESEHAHMADGELVVDDRAGFLDATRLEGFPDPTTREALRVGAADPCAVLADVPEDLQRPVVDLSDVKPGDVGEVRFDFSLCSNPGLAWLDATLRANREAGFTEPERSDPDEYSEGSPPVAGDSSVLTIANDVLEVTVSTDLSGSLAGQPWTYTLPDGDTERFLFFEIYALRDDANRAATSIGGFAADFPPTGVPGTTYPGTYTTSVDGVALSVTRTFTLDPADGLLTAGYRFENVDPATAIEDLRFTGYVDYDAGEFSNTDVARFRSDAPRSLEYVLQTELPGFGDARDVYAGFGAVESPVAHQVGNRARVLNDVFSPARLDGDDAHDGDVGFALEYSLGRLDPGDTATLTTNFAVAPSPLILKALLLKPRLGLGNGDLADEIRTTLRYGDAFEGGGTTAFEGSLAQFLALATTGHGLPLEGDDDGGGPADGSTGPTRDCLPASPAVHHVGLRWSLPVDHGNEVQGDTIRFDLGLSAEQCRHNERSGVDPGAALVGTLSADRDGGAVEFTYLVENTAPGPVEVVFPSAIEADVAAFRDGTERWRWSDDRGIPQDPGPSVVTTRTFDPGEAVRYTRTWKDPIKGPYTAVATLEARNASVRAVTRVDGDGPAGR